MSFENKHIIVTGGAKGIGESCVKIFHREGGSVTIMDLDEEAGNNLASALGERALFLKCDVASENDIKSAINEGMAEYGDVDVLVNNAGILSYYTVTESTSEQWDRVMEINLRSAFLCAKYAIPSMQKKGKGVVVNLSSAQAFVSQASVAAYTTSKTAILGLTRSIAVDYAPNIRCFAVCPGTVDTPMNRKAFQESPDPEDVLQECIDMHLLKRIAKPEEIGELIVFLTGEKAPFITGQAIRIDGGLGIKAEGSKR